MPQINDDDLQDIDVVISLLGKGLHGGFLPENKLTADEIELREDVEWMEMAVKFMCSVCGEWHETRPGEEKCLKQEQPIDSEEFQSGYRLTVDGRLDISHETDYTLAVSESSSTVNTRELPYKSIIFVPDEENLVFDDPAGSIVFLPLDALANFASPDSREGILNEISEKRKKLIDWQHLDDSGNQFQEVIFRLIKRDDTYFNERWGGSGQDQGKDGFCSVDLGGREVQVLIQAKFNNEGSSISSSQVETSCRKATRHECRGLIIGAVKTSGDLESEFQKGAFLTRDVIFFRLWSGPEIKERLSQHPDLIAEFFLE